MCRVGKLSSSEEDESSGNDDIDMSDSSSDSDGDYIEYVTGEVPPNSQANSGGSNTAEGGQPGEEEEDDELVKAIQAARNKTSEHPPEIDFEDLIVDVSFHPGENIIAAASITGDVLLYKYSNESNELIDTWELHTKACRDIEYSDDGSMLFSCSKDRCVMVTDTQTGKLKRFYEEAHEDPLYSLYVFNENCICTGDENGTVKMWDIRQEKPVVSFKEAEDYISDMVTTNAKKFLVCSSGDGVLTTYNMNARKLVIQSEDYDAEMTCLELFKNESKLLAGTSKGRTYLFNWGEFAYHSDEFFGPKRSVNTLLAITENIAIAGYEDGNIRAINLFPHRHLGVVGQHDFSIEAMDISHDGELIASAAVDQKIRFWNVKYFEDVQVTEDKVRNRRAGFQKNLPSSKYKDSSDFFSGLA